MKKIILLLVVMLSTLSFADKAKMNVITDIPAAKIYVDGVFAGYDAVQNYEVDPGEHYLMVSLNGKKIFARTYTLESGELKTIPTAHFVDFKTNVASRGAIDVEAARIRETRGDFGIGIQASSGGSLGGVSIKKWFTDRLGVQFFGLINNESEGIKYQSGGRVLFWLADKVMFDAPFSGYVYVGGGTDKLIVADNNYNNVARSISNGGVGVEFSVFGVNGLYMNLELGAERQYLSYSDPSKDSEVVGNMLGSGGLHLYF